MASQKEHPQASRIIAKVREAKTLDFHSEGAQLMKLLVDIEQLALNDLTRVSNW